jgi:transcriptional regulator ATRX
LRPNEAENRQIHTVLLVAPVNTIANWENEFEKWTGKLKRPLRVDNLNNTDISARGTVLRRWAKRGGVLLVSEATFTATLKKDADNAQYFQDPGPDAIVLDEAHSMLKNRNNVVFKALNGVTTRRRICLTGSPYQNNLFEYFRMIGYIRPGVLGKSEGTFERQYVNPIADGIASDASEKAKALADDKLSEIQQKLEPYVNRKDASVLLEDLPPMQQVVLHLRQTKLQARLYGAFKKHQKKGDGDFQNFLKTYHELRPIHNHPGCLLLRARAAAGSDISNTKRAAVPPKTAETIANGNDTKAAEKPQDTSTEAGINEKPEAAEAKVETLDHPGATAVSIKAEQRAPDPTEVIELLSDSDIEMDEDEVVQKSDEEDGQVQIPEEGKATPAKLSQSEKYDDDPEEEWYARIARRYGAEKMNQIENGNKVVMLLHILVHASILDEKVVLFTQCLKVRRKTCFEDSLGTCKLFSLNYTSPDFGFYPSRFSVGGLAGTCSIACIIVSQLQGWRLEIRARLFTNRWSCYWSRKRELGQRVQRGS